MLIRFSIKPQCNSRKQACTNAESVWLPQSNNNNRSCTVFSTVHAHLVTLCTFGYQSASVQQNVSICGLQVSRVGCWQAYGNFHSSSACASGCQSMFSPKNQPIYCVRPCSLVCRMCTHQNMYQHLGYENLFCRSDVLPGRCVRWDLLVPGPNMLADACLQVHATDPPHEFSLTDPPPIIIGPSMITVPMAMSMSKRISPSVKSMSLHPNLDNTRKCICAWRIGEGWTHLWISLRLPDLSLIPCLGKSWLPKPHV